MSRKKPTDEESAAIIAASERLAETFSLRLSLEEQEESDCLTRTMNHLSRWRSIDSLS